MRVSEFVVLMTKFQAEHGDLEVETSGSHGWREPHKGPKLGHARVLTGRERNPAWALHADHSGHAVCRI